MARCLRVLTTTVALMVAIAAGSASATVYRACLQASSGGKTWYYEIRTDQADQAQGTTLDRWIVNGATSYVDRNRYAAFHEPAAGTTTWDEGVAFAATMQTRNAWLNTEQTKAASWVNDPAGGGVTWTFKTTVNGAPQDYIFRTSQCHDVQQPDTDAPTDPQEPDTDAPAVACKGYGGYGDLECSGGDTCCGAGGMSPHCVASDNGDKCCTWFLSSATCSATQSCCGELGVGASSHAFCCDAGTECCQAQVGYSGVATCCPAGTKCCRASTVGLCCAMDEECDVSFNRCKKASGTDAPTDPQEPDTPAPTPAPAPASTVHACLQASSGGKTYYYEIFSDPSDDAKGTTFDRYTVAGGVDTFLDSNTFAALRAAPGGAPWNQGIQFADAMQSRGVWINVEPTTAASIAHASGEDTLIFKTTVNGGPQDYIFKSSQCR